MPQTIVEQIQDGMAFWEKLVGLKPNVCYLGQYEAEQWDKQDEAVTAAFFKNPRSPDATTIDVIIHRVTDRSYMGFGV